MRAREGTITNTITFEQHIQLTQIQLKNTEMEDSMIFNMSDDDRIGNKRGRDHIGDQDQEIHKERLEKRPSGVFGVTDTGDHVGDAGNEGGETDTGGGSGGGGGVIGGFISSVFHGNRSGGGEREVESGVVDGEKSGDLGVDGGGGDDGGEGGEGGGGGGIISSFFSNVFHNKGSGDEDGDQVKSDHLRDAVAEKAEYPDGGGGENGCRGGGSGDEPEDLDAEKLGKKKDEVVNLPSKDPNKGEMMKLKPDDYSERVFFLNNN